MYAWAPIRFGTGEKDDAGNFESKTLRVGAEVNKGDLGLSDEDWDYLVSNGSIREDAYPIPKEELNKTSLESPRDVIIREAKAVMERAQNQVMFASERVEVPPN